MSHLLDGCRAKIERANENIKNLEAEIAAFVDPSNQSVVSHVDPDAKRCDFVALGQEVPLRFSILIGEIIHHLRSSLDHLVWALVLKRHKTPTFRVQFPACLTAKEFKAAKDRGIINGISRSAQAIIERLQPYNTANWRATVSDQPLRIVHDLDIADKHKLLTVAVSATYIPNKLQFSGNMADTQIERIIPDKWADRLLRADPNGTNILTIEFIKMHPDLKVKADFTFQVAFEQFGTREIEPVISGLSHLHNAVVKTIKQFEGEF